MDDEKTFRAFFAVDVPSEIRPHILSEINTLKSDPKFLGIRWIPEENLHITLRFLGSISQEQSELLIAQATEGLASVKAFPLELTSVISFPPDGDHHIIAMKPKHITSLSALALLLEEFAIENGLPKEQRVYTPHLTIGKTKNHAEFIGLDKEIKIAPLKFVINNIKLLRSNQTAEGTQYSEIVTIPLNG